jgi:hypothetical protein
MTKNFETVFVTIVNPRNGDCGVVEEGRYRIEGDLIVLVDIHGNKRRDAKGRLIQKRLVPGESHRKVAARLTREHVPNRRGDFNRKIIYPPTGRF